MADTKVSALTAITGANVDTAADVLAIVDTSATATKKILVDELRYPMSVIAQNSKSADYTTVLTDVGKQILHPSTDNNPRTFTIDSNANVAYPIGTSLTFVNRINTLTIAITADTLYTAGTGVTGSRTLAAFGEATALKIATAEWMISGVGMT